MKPSQTKPNQTKSFVATSTPPTAEAVRGLSQHCRRRSAASLFLCSSDQPLENSVEIGLFFCADAIAADLAVRNRFEAQSFDKLVYRQLAGKIGLVAKYKKRDAFQCWLLKQKLELLARHRKRFAIGRVHDKSGAMSDTTTSRARLLHHGIYPAAVPLPHGSKSRLASKIPTVVPKVVSRYTPTG